MGFTGLLFLGDSQEDPVDVRIGVLDGILHLHSIIQPVLLGYLWLSTAGCNDQVILHLFFFISVF